MTRATRLGLLDGAISAVTAISEGDGREPMDLRSRLGWVHRALALSPYSESLLARAVDLHQQRGDRGGALREVDRFSRRLRKDMGLQDSRLVEGMRARSSSPGGAKAVGPTAQIRLPADGLRVELEEILSGRLERVERLVADGDPQATFRVIVERGADGAQRATVRIEGIDV